MNKIIVFGFLLSSIISFSQVKTSFNQPPEWSKKVVWYQIFLERFRNGDSSNDPRKEDIKGSYPGFIPENWQTTPWNQSWYKEDVYFPEYSKGKDFNGNAIENLGQKVQLRRYGGDLQGVLDKIDYLDSLGITAIYFNPLNDAPSLHKYDARNWRHIDRNFGPNPKKDVEIMQSENPTNPNTWKMTTADSMFVEVVGKLHKRGIRVILDYSWNHTGNTFWAWEDVVKNQENSKYKDWYWVHSFDNPETLENEFKYQGWFNVPDLPEIKETQHVDHTEGIIPFHGDIYSQEVKQHIFNVSKRWLDPNGDGDCSDGIDGFRLDVAAELPLEFWEEYRTFVRTINPDAYIIGEVWWEKFPNKLLNPKPYLNGKIFDAVMNYRWYRSARDFFNESPNVIPVTEFVDSLNSYRKNIDVNMNYAMMNLNASHDTPRVLTSLFNKTGYKQTSAEDYKTQKPNLETYKILKLLLAHQFTYIGSPHVWAGDEMGMWGADDPHTRKPLIWKDFEYENEVHDGFNDEVKFNDDLFIYYQKVISIRNENPVLQTGELEFIKQDNENRILAYSRFNQNKEILVVFNMSNEPKEIKLKVRRKDYSPILNQTKIKEKDNFIKIKLEPKSSEIIASKS
ncbi:MAG: glycoside hydrolase family 13 protein [Flavobacteriales bacterium]|nr:glycoside hydrolase family 13 protein [Flavobacteriales bacterium]